MHSTRLLDTGRSDCDGGSDEGAACTQWQARLSHLHEWRPLPPSVDGGGRRSHTTKAYATLRWSQPQTAATVVATLPRWRRRVLALRKRRGTLPVQCKEEPALTSAAACEAHVSTMMCFLTVERRREYDVNVGRCSTIESAACSAPARSRHLPDFECGGRVDCVRVDCHVHTQLLHHTLRCQAGSSCALARLCGLGFARRRSNVLSSK